MSSISSDDCQLIDDENEKEKLSDSDDIDESSLSSSRSDSSDDCPYSIEIASKISAAFAKATGIDIEIAVQLLKDHEWSIDEALKATYEAKEHAESIVTAKHDWKNSQDKYFRILSWNTDTTDTDDTESSDLIQQRAETLIEILLREKPDVILLQQVGTFALTLIITCLSSLYDDESVQIDSPSNSNYVSIFTRKSTIKKKNVTTIKNYGNWKMLKVEVEYKNSMHFDLYNAAIDQNTAPFCFQALHDNNSNHIVICATSSDMLDNVWNSHTIQLDDLWQTTEERPEAKYTFDPELNSNITIQSEPQRYDRVFFRTSSDHQFKPVHMELEGVQHINTSDAIFPSTHWAIQGYFDLVN